MKYAKLYAKEYLKYSQNRGDSARTLRLVGSALGKVFGCPSNEFGFKFPEWPDRDRTRSVKNTNYDRVVEHRNAENIGVLEITGFRRFEAENTSRDQISPNYDKIYNVIGKGGRKRTITLLVPGVLKEFVNTHPRDDGLLFGKLEKI